MHQPPIALLKKISREISSMLPVPTREGSVPEPAAPSSCHQGDAPGSAGPLSSAKTATQHPEEGQNLCLSCLAQAHVRLRGKDSM